MADRERDHTTNAAIADALDELGDLYELDGAIVHRVTAYRTAAQAVRDAPTSVAELALAGRATEMAGIGNTLQEKILALVSTGSIPSAEKLRARFPPGLVEMTRLPGLGPKRARRLFDELGLDSLDALRAAADGQRLRAVKGFGPKFEATVLEALAAGPAVPAPRRFVADRARAEGEELVAGLLGAVDDPGVRIALAGSIRRRADSVKDLDIVAATADPDALVAALAGLPQIQSAQSNGTAGAQARTHTGIPVELRVSEPAALGNLLQHLTGSGRHNAALREAAVRRGLHVSEYGIASDETGETLLCATEEEVYDALGLAYIEPELREDRGELEAAAAGCLPALVEVGDVRGDLHCHTVASDGRNTIEEMALAALARGYEYLAITDHSATHGFGNDVSPAELERHMERVRAVDGRIDGIRVLAGTEVNILSDGSPDYSDELLAALDWVVGSVHTAFQIGRESMTARMVRAMEHPLVDAIGHPTGRLIGRREPYAVDVDELIAAAQRTGTMLEINSNPNRRDLNEVHARAAAGADVPLLINSDAHGVERLAVVEWGVATARRAWLGAAAIANTRSWDELRALRKPARR